MPLRKLGPEHEWQTFWELRNQALALPYKDWSMWVVQNIKYAASCKVAKQLGLQTPGLAKPSFLYYTRLRQSKEDGTLEVFHAD